MEQNDVKWIVRTMLASALSADDGKVRNEILHCVFIVRNRALFPLSFGKGANRDFHAWVTMREHVHTESMVLAGTFDGNTFAYRPSVDRVLSILADAEEHAGGKQWWLAMRVNDTVFIPGH